jgi:hypothetical protein
MEGALDPGDPGVNANDDANDDWLGGYRAFDAFERFAEAQRLGLDAASSLWSRWVEMFAESTDGQDPQGEPVFGARRDGHDARDRRDDPDDQSGDDAQGDARDGIRAMRAEAARSMDTVLEMARRLFESTLDLADAAMSRPNVAAWLADESGPEQLRVEVAAGADATASVWLHHREATTASKVRFSATPLRDAAGTEPVASITFDPPSLVDVAPSETRSTTIHVQVDDTCPPGTYYGLVLAEGAEHLALTLRVVVTAAPRPA